MENGDLLVVNENEKERSQLYSNHRAGHLRNENKSPKLVSEKRKQQNRAAQQTYREPSFLVTYRQWGQLFATTIGERRRKRLEFLEHLALRPTSLGVAPSDLYVSQPPDLNVGVIANTRKPEGQVGDLHDPNSVVSCPPDYTGIFEDGQLEMLSAFAPTIDDAWSISDGQGWSYHIGTRSPPNTNDCYDAIFAPMGSDFKAQLDVLDQTEMLSLRANLPVEPVPVAPIDLKPWSNVGPMESWIHNLRDISWDHVADGTVDSSGLISIHRTGRSPFQCRPVDIRKYFVRLAPAERRQLVAMAKNHDFSFVDTICGGIATLSTEEEHASTNRAIWVDRSNTIDLQHPQASERHCSSSVLRLSPYPQNLRIERISYFAAIFANASALGFDFEVYLDETAVSPLYVPGGPQASKLERSRIAKALRPVPVQLSQRHHAYLVRGPFARYVLGSARRDTEVQNLWLPTSDVKGPHATAHALFQHQY